MMLFLKLIKESLLFALNAIVVNKLRTILSLLGITIGIFSIISVFTIFDSMENYVRKNIESLGDNVIFIRKWPQFEFNPNYPWWEYWKRPTVSIDELKEIEKRSKGMDYGVFVASTSKSVDYLGNTIESATILGVSQDYDKVLSIELLDGRYFTPIESNSGRNVAILGYEIAENLFENIDPIGKKIKIFGRKLKVIGVLAKEGDDNLGGSFDDQVILPVNFIRNIIDIKNERYGGTIIIKGKPNVSNDELKDELIGNMRSIRKLKPSADDNFSIEEITLLAKAFDSIFSMFSIVGWIIGMFSLLVGGFGIANIMFVSVRERTGIIGIQKALGAKRYFILFQFLFEAVFLCLIGGLLGLLIVYIGTIIGTNAMGMELILTRGNVLLTLLITSLIGLLSGIIPAFFAARMHPVEAIRTTA
ncbi:MAG: ABC transporter permease [Saprospiraceae bacterium]|nr:ABC transporter permease [Saprospiraceae bacterium]